MKIKKIIYAYLPFISNLTIKRNWKIVSQLTETKMNLSNPWRLFLSNGMTLSLSREHFKTSFLSNELETLIYILTVIVEQKKSKSVLWLRKPFVYRMLTTKSFCLHISIAIELFRRLMTVTSMTWVPILVFRIRSPYISKILFTYEERKC